MDSNELLKLSSLLNNSIRFAEIDYASSLILIRKILETVISSYYDIKGIKKPVDDKGYTVLSDLINDLHHRKIITADFKKHCDYIRKLGNNAAHYTDVHFTKGEMRHAIRIICGIVNNLLRRQNSTNNSVYLLTLRKGHLSREIKVSKKFTRNFGHIRDIITKSIFISFNYLTDLYEEIDDDFFIDEDLNQYMAITFDLVFKYYDWYWDFDPDDYRGGFFSRLLGGTEKVTPASTFKEYYEDKLISYYEQRAWIKEKYNL